MKKSIHRPEHKKFSALLRTFREEAGLTQIELAERFDRAQSFVSAVERGITRLDIVQIREWAMACGTTLPVAAARFDEAVRRAGGTKKAGRAKST